MKRIAAFISMVILVFSFVFSPFGFYCVTNAQIIEAEEQINMLFDKMSETLALSMLTEDASVVQNYEESIAKIEDQLENLGVKELSKNELNQFFQEKNGSVTRDSVSKPENTNTVKWYLVNYTNYSYYSKNYDIQRLVALGNNPGGTLVTGEDNYRFYSNAEKAANAISTAIGIYAQKAIGKIPVVEWTPYELLFSNTTTDVFNSSYVTHRCVSAIAFTYVKESTQGDDDYSLSFYSNHISIAIHAHGAAVVNSVPTTYSKQTTETISADYYNSVTSAIRSFKGEIGCYNYINYYEIESYDGQYTKRIYVPTPLAGPGQIY